MYILNIYNTHMLKQMCDIITQKRRIKLKRLNLLEKDIEIDKATRALKAMAHPLRLKILCALKNDEMAVLEIVRVVGSSQSNVSQHIDILRTENILESRREGNRILCRVKDNKILTLISNMRNVFCEIPCEAGVQH